MGCLSTVILVRFWPHHRNRVVCPVGYNVYFKKSLIALLAMFKIKCLNFNLMNGRIITASAINAINKIVPNIIHPSLSSVATFAWPVSATAIYIELAEHYPDSQTVQVC